MNTWWWLMAGCGGEPEVEDDAPEPTSQTAEGWQCYARFEHDDHLDGVVDQTGLDGYDSARPDLLVWRGRDTDLDGEFDLATTYGYDEAGQRISLEEDEGADGTVDYQEAYSLDAEGRLLRYEGGWGIWTYSYDARGDLILLERDWEGDGQLDERVEYAYLAPGQLLEERWDEGLDGVEFVRAYAYDDQGREIAVQEDEGADGSWEGQALTTYTDPVLRVGFTDHQRIYFTAIEHFEYSAGDLLLYQGYDDDSDGNLDDETTYTWDEEHGLLLSIEDHSLDTDSRVSQIFEYDAQQRLVRHRDERNWIEPGADELIEGWEETWTFSGSCP